MAAASVVIGLSVWVHPLAPVVLIFAGWVAILGASSAFVGLLIFMLVLFTRPAEFVPALSVLKLAKVGALGSMALFAVDRLMARELRIARLASNPWIIWLTVAVVLSAQRGSDPGDSMAYFKDIFVKILVLYFLITNLVDDTRRALTVNVAIVGATVFLALYAVYMKATGQATIESSRAGGVGMLADPNDLALTLLMGMPFAVSAFMRLKGFARALALVASVVLIAGIVATQSRGGLLGCMAALYVLLRKRFNSKILVYGIVAVALVGMVAMMGIAARQGLGGGGLDESAQGRLDAWYAGARMFRANPVLGVGFSQFLWNYFDYVVDPAEWKMLEAHNTWIQVIAETGLMGFIPFCGLLFVTVKTAWQLSIVEPSARAERALSEAPLATVAAIGVCCFFLSQGWNWFLYILIAQTMAVGAIFRVPAALPRSMRPPPSPPPPSDPITNPRLGAV